MSEAPKNVSVSPIALLMSICCAVLPPSDNKTKTNEQQQQKQPKKSNQSNGIQTVNVIWSVWVALSVIVLCLVCACVLFSRLSGICAQSLSMWLRISWFDTHMYKYILLNTHTYASIQHFPSISVLSVLSFTLPSFIV